LTIDIFDNSSASQLEYILDLTARFALTVPGTTDENIIPVSTTASLRLAGIAPENGTYTPPECVNFTAAAIPSEVAINYVETSSKTNIDLGNGWNMLAPEYMGKYGTNYAARAYVARWGYLGMTEDEAIYPSYLDGIFSLQPNESYKLQFVGKPPLKDDGFWSVTMYNANGYLTENAINRYSIGDRSNLTYADGTLVYGSDANSTFEVIVQATQPPDQYIAK
jgi:hypothetical protein